jgi:hypothetical protein
MIFSRTIYKHLVPDGTHFPVFLCKAVLSFKLLTLADAVAVTDALFEDPAVLLYFNVAL